MPSRLASPAPQSLLRRLEHAWRQREMHWGEMNAADRYMMNKAVDVCVKDCWDAGCGPESRLLLDALQEGER